jgi:hypothetical protein
MVVCRFLIAVVYDNEFLLGYVQEWKSMVTQGDTTIFRYVRIFRRIITICHIFWCIVIVLFNTLTSSFIS